MLMQRDPFRYRVATEQKRCRLTIKPGPTRSNLLASPPSASAASQNATSTTSAHPKAMSTSARIMLTLALSTLLLGGNAALGKPADSRMARVARQAIVGAANRRTPIPHSQTGTNLWGLDVIIQTADGNADTAPEVGPKCEAFYGECSLTIDAELFVLLALLTTLCQSSFDRDEVWLQEASRGRKVGLGLSV